MSEQEKDRGYYIAKIEVLEKKQEEMYNDIKEIRKILAEKQGGTKYLFALLTVATMMGGLADRLISWLKVM